MNNFDRDLGDLEKRVRDLEMRLVSIEARIATSENKLNDIRGGFVWAGRIVGGVLLTSLMVLLMSGVVPK